ncbi:MAG: CDGSH iron-sulfur domain-containing protein [Chloroflexi bacterium]|nr:CDGSH iron-sulfur domain-containing protein [Chloroflexota bacterium]
MAYTLQDKDRHYIGKNADVTYNVTRCIHAKECITRLSQVFDPDRWPWLQVGDTPGDSLVDVVSACPSGALHVRRKDGGDSEPVPAENRITVQKDGPLHVRGNLKITAAEVNIAGETRAMLCRCGASVYKPFCDNSHNEIGFTDSVPSVPRLANATDADGGVLHIIALPNGSLSLSGSMSIVDATGAEIFAGNHVLLCRCGGSSSMPFCDDTHQTNGFKTE